MAICDKRGLATIRPGKQARKDRARETSKRWSVANKQKSQQETSVEGVKGEKKTGKTRWPKEEGERVEGCWVGNAERKTQYRKHKDGYGNFHNMGRGETLKPKLKTLWP